MTLAEWLRDILVSHMPNIRSFLDSVWVFNRIKSLENKMESSTLQQAQTNAALRAQGVTLASQAAQVEQIKKDLTDAKTDLAGTKDTLTAVATDIVTLRQTIADLQSQVDAGQPIDLSDLVAQADELKLQADGILAEAGAIDPAPVAVTPPPSEPVVTAPPVEVPPVDPVGGASPVDQ